MQGQAGHPVVRRRALRAGIRGLASLVKGMDSTRKRRGTMALVRSVWRRIAPGTNHIACFGVWRRGTRRQLLRPNRAGITRWHMPYRRKPLPTISDAVMIEEEIVQS
jgi:hypothetical protein